MSFVVDRKSEGALFLELYAGSDFRFSRSGSHQNKLQFILNYHPPVSSQLMGNTLFLTKDIADNPQEITSYLVRARCRRLCGHLLRCDRKAWLQASR